MNQLSLIFLLIRECLICAALIVIECLPLINADILFYDLVLRISGLLLGERLCDLSRIKPERLGQCINCRTDKIIIGIDDLAVENNIICLLRGGQDRPVPVKDISPLICQNFR